MSIGAIGSSESASIWESLFNSSASSSSSGSSSRNSSKSGQSGGISSKLFTELDADKSGSLSFEESGLDRETYDSLDTDGDGVVSLEELENALELQRAAMQTRMRLATESPEQQSAQEILASLLGGGESPPPPPAGGPGKAGDDEDEEEDWLDELFGAKATQVLDAMDTDGDGIVTAAERSAAAAQQAQSGLFNLNSAYGQSRNSRNSLLNSFTNNMMYSMNGGQLEARSMGIDLIA